MLGYAARRSVPSYDTDQPIPIVVVFSPQILQNFQRGNVDALSIQFIIVWLLGDVFNIIGAVMQGVLPTMVRFAKAACYRRSARAHHSLPCRLFSLSITPWPILCCSCSAFTTADLPGKTLCPLPSPTTDRMSGHPSSTRRKNAEGRTGLDSRPLCRTSRKRPRNRRQPRPCFNLFYGTH